GQGQSCAQETQQQSLLYGTGRTHRQRTVRGDRSGRWVRPTSCACASTSASGQSTCPMPGMWVTMLSGGGGPVVRGLATSLVPLQLPCEIPSWQALYEASSI